MHLEKHVVNDFQILAVATRPRARADGALGESARRASKSAAATSRHSRKAPAARFIFRIAVPGLIALLLGACASFAPTDVRPGQSADDVTRLLGAPTGRYRLPDGGSRLEYARGPYGLQTWMVDLDASGQVRQVQQVLTENNFATLRVGDTREQVLLTMGRPGYVAGAWRDRTLWYWRYDNYVCRVFVVTLTPNDQLQDAGSTPDPACFPNVTAGR